MLALGSKLTENCLAVINTESQRAPPTLLANRSLVESMDVFFFWDLERLELWVITPITLAIHSNSRLSRCAVGGQVRTDDGEVFMLTSVAGLSKMKYKTYIHNPQGNLLIALMLRDKPG